VFSPQEFQQTVLAWFDDHGRHDLPWQQNPTPYRVWVSEIMLQQTQVQTVIPYFHRFMQAFPDVNALAAASEDEVLHLWTGLGYYARARNLHKCARTVCQDLDGSFPDTVEALQELPGIGRSTAGAIRSIAFGAPAPILDGNVKRVLARYGAIDGWPGKTQVSKDLWAMAELLSPERRAADYSQAMMDLGATLCTRGQPACDRCPLAARCLAHQAGTQADYPGRKPRKELPVRSTAMMIVTNPAGEVYLQRRPSQGLWGGLWSFPEVANETAARDHCLDRFNCEPTAVQPWEPLRHTFSHYHLDIQPLHLELPCIPDTVMEGEGQLWYNRSRPDAVGMAAPVSKLLNLLD
jgi:A/G-specific adenine glycosylase